MLKKVVGLILVSIVLEANVALAAAARPVPFVLQAPTGQWRDQRQQDGCEEASALMAYLWVNNLNELTPTVALQKLLAIDAWEVQNYGSFHDTSASTTAQRILQAHLGLKKIKLQQDISLEELIKNIEAGNLLMAPMDGQKLHNPYFTQPGPDRHVLLIIGYDQQAQEFITNDPGTRHGRGYRYKKAVLWQAIRDYPTGDHLPIRGAVHKNVIVIGR